MKQILIIVFFALGFVVKVQAGYLVNVPQTLTQPDGQIIQCFASGDEFYNWLHDENGFTIVQAPDGYYYYAEKVNGKITASRHVVNRVNPAKTDLKPHLKVDLETYLEKRRTKFFQHPASKSSHSTGAKNIGVLNAITIYIRFSDDPEFTSLRIKQQHGNFSDPDLSVNSYYKNVSYQQLDIQTTHIPANNTNEITSYVSSHPRGYFQPYNATRNPEGYNPDDDAERARREWVLLRDAINWAKTNHPIPNDVNLDGDEDGYADLVCFIIKGRSDGWNELLWAHKWSLQTVSGVNYETAIQGTIKIREYTFQPEEQTTVTTLCHESFHALGAPDLYHYVEPHNNLAPASRWDLMESGSGHMLAYMKMEYGKWIDEASIVEITDTGVYTLYSQGLNPHSNLFKIAGKTPEYFLVEYRQQNDDQYEVNLPGSGLIVTRINSRMSGNANYNGTSRVDEVYVLRPGGSPTSNGDPLSAHLSNLVWRTELSKNQMITPFYSDGTVADFIISEITDFGDSIQFRYAPVIPVDTTASIQKDAELAIQLFPNPSASGIFYLESDGQDLQLEVFDLSGRSIWSQKTASNNEKIDLSNQKSGMFFLRIIKGQQQKTFKLIKKG